MSEEPQESVEASDKKPGCLTISFIVGVALIIGAAALINRWDDLGGPTRAGLIVGVVAGSLLAAPMTLLLLFKLWLRYVLGSTAEALAEGMKKAVKQGKRIYGKEHVLRDAVEEDYDGMNRALYDDATSRLEALGYRRLGDIVNETVEEIFHPTIPIRVMVSPRGDTVVGVYQFKTPNPADASWKREVITCDFDSEFTDGSFVSTANTEGRDLMTPPPTLHRRQFDLDTPVATLAAAHAAELQARLKARPDVTTITVTTMADARASQRRLEALKRAFREEIGYVDPDEMRRIAKKGNADDLTADMAADAADEARRRPSD